MDALTNLVNNIPDWQQKLDELNGKIAQRQIELAQLTVNQNSSTDSSGGNCYPPSASKSVRNKGSTESLKPPGEPAAHPRGITPQPESDALQSAAIITSTSPKREQGQTQAQQQQQQQQQQQKNEIPSSPSESQSPSAILRQTNQMRAAGQARARATLRKRQRTDSMISAEGAVPKYRTRSMIIVYYDSYVQSFFEELVKFVSASRNMMRKAKMAAKVAQIKRLAELEMPDESDENEDADGSAGAATAALMPQPSTTGPNKSPQIIAASTPAAFASADQPIEAGNVDDNADDDIPALRFVSTRGRMPPSMARTQNLLSPGRAGMGLRASAAGRMMSPYARTTRGGPSANDPPDVYDDLDKGLEYVQSMCEQAAHQFLRDGDCTEYVTDIQRSMGKTKELADKEMERVQKEDPEGLKEAQESLKGRSYRPQSMRKAGGKPGVSPSPSPAPGTGDATPELSNGMSSPGASPAPVLAPAENGTSNALEVDEGFEDIDYEVVIPKLAYKSTRMMR